MIALVFRFAAFLLFAGMATSAAFADLIFNTKSGEEVKLVVTSADSPLTRDRDVFVESFCHTYQEVPFSEVNPLFKTLADLRGWLESAFEEDVPEIQEGIRGGSIYYVRAFLRGELVGLVSFEKMPERPNSVYVRQLAIDPAYQGLGIGKYLLFSIKEDPSLLPDTKSIYLVTRRFNQKAIGFYQRLGFRLGTYTREGYDPSRYVGLEWREKLD